MALIKLGPGITDIRGKFGGVYFTRDRSGLHQTVNYSKRNWQPTEGQYLPWIGMWGVVRWWYACQMIGTLIFWQIWARTHPWYNSLGEVIYITGWNWFLHFNLYRYLNDLAPILLPPETELYYTVTGTLTPDATGSYKPIGYKNQYPYWKHVSKEFYIYWLGDDMWFVAPNLQAPFAHHWKRLSESPFGQYQPIGVYTGIATVTSLAPS